MRVGAGFASDAESPRGQRDFDFRRQASHGALRPRSQSTRWCWRDRAVHSHPV